MCHQCRTRHIPPHGHIGHIQHDSRGPRAVVAYYAELLTVLIDYITIRQKKIF